MPSVASRNIDFTCSGSSDYLAGQAFSFVMTLDAVGAWPPIDESHVEMDGAWALYEAWVKIQTGEVDTALVYGYSQVLARRPAPGAVAVSSTPTTTARSGPTRSRWPACRPGPCSTPVRSPPSRWPRSRPQPRPPRPTTRTPSSRARRRSTSCSPTEYLLGPAAPPRLPADHRRRRRGRAGRRRHGPRAGRAPGVDPRHRPPHRQPQPRRPRPDPVAVDRAGRREGRRGRRPGRRGRAARTVQPTRS